MYAWGRGLDDLEKFLRLYSSCMNEPEGLDELLFTFGRFPDISDGCSRRCGVYGLWNRSVMSSGEVLFFQLL